MSMFKGLMMLAFGVAVIYPLSVSAQPKSADVSLVTTAVSFEKPGKYQVGVLLKVNDGMHIYWKNPGGENGIPTSVKWDLPAGVTVSSIEWPTPISFKNADDSRGIGYEGEVLLKAELNTSDAKGVPTVGAQVRWLACKDDACFPGRAKLTLEASGDKAKEAEALWGRYKEKYPAASVPEGVVVTNSGVGLTVSASEFDVAEFFPESGAVVTAKKSDDGKFVLKTDSPKGVLSLRGKEKTKAFEVK